ncbi:MAG: hypothetical protein WCL29_08535 [Pseudomonadota bacterium]
MAEIKPIRIIFKEVSAPATTALSEETTLADRFAAVANVLITSHAQVNAAESIRVVADFLEAIILLDDHYGADSVLPVENAANLADEAIRAIADISRLGLEYAIPKMDATVDNIVIGIGLWCMRHKLAIFSPEPIVNALARRANEATNIQEIVATYALMKAFVLHLAPSLKSDLERSNPERPWRLLNVNLAITAIRTGDATMMRAAFDSLNDALPDERSGFYAEAYTLASQPGFPTEIRALIEREHRQFTLMHQGNSSDALIQLNMR